MNSKNRIIHISLNLASVTVLFLNKLLSEYQEYIASTTFIFSNCKDGDLSFIVVESCVVRSYGITTHLVQYI